MNLFQERRIIKYKSISLNACCTFIVLFVVFTFLSFTLNFSGSQAAEKNTSNITIEGYESELIYIKTAQGRFKFTAEIADSPKKTQSGLMFRESMPFNHGMLFDFHEEKEVFMWMKNTPLSLDMVFLSPMGRVVNIENNTTPFSQNIITSKVLASGVFEINAGTSKLIGLKIGDLLEHHSFDQGNDGYLKEKAN